MLATLGFTFDGEQLERWQIEAYRIIQNALNDEEMKEIKQKR